MWKRRVVLVLLCCVCRGLAEYLSLAEGDSCTWQGAVGTCVQVHRCLSADEYINKKKDPPPISYSAEVSVKLLRHGDYNVFLLQECGNNSSVICEYQGTESVICCIDCDLVKDARLIIIDDGYRELLYKNGYKPHDYCIDIKHHIGYTGKADGAYQRSWKVNETRKCQELVIAPVFLVSPAGGTDVKKGEYPHMALLGYGVEWMSAQWLCGGTLISATFVLTAAHCISSPLYGPVTYVGLGKIRRSEEHGLWLRYRVKRVIPHPDYRPPSKYHDIALLETHTPVTFYWAVKPACIYLDRRSLSDFNVALGWGALGHRKELAEILQAVSLQEFTEEECKREYPPHRHLVNGYNHTTQMCFGRRDEIIDTCGGDSGGPLHVSGWLSHHVMGVTSFGKDCGITAGAGIYTRVSFYLPWIESIVWPEE